MAEGIQHPDRILKCYYCFLTIILVLTGSIESKVYTVGDEDGWNTGTDYQRWSQKYNFSVGDVLDFDYVKGQHNTIEVTEDTFRSCDTGRSGAVIQRYDSGHDKVVLAQARKYWFVCDVSGHCLGGMKFGIDVIMITNNNTNISPNPGSTSESLIPPPPQTNGVLHLQRRLAVPGGNYKAWTNYAIVAFGISLIIPINYW
ncbi:Plastocyanin-like [Macleaya cordata]|uniref:Plastocyanin-like n=1 Tax=Macleaya cordata TaxID=56857 RepID=A0A200RAT8_MACCD|nr:Plastocyanin-like [Macleaya cordata]